MSDLIEALQIFVKYKNDFSPIYCEHDILHIFISPSLVSKEDIKRLEELSFKPYYEDDDCFYSLRFGSC